MQLGLYCTTLAVAAARLFKVSRLRKTMNRSMKSGAEGNSVHSRSNFRETEQGQPQLSNDEEFPSLSDGLRSKQGKWRTRMDLHTLPKHKSEEIQSISPSQLESKKGKKSTRIDLHTLQHNSEEIQSINPSQLESNQNDTDLPASFGKNPSSSPNLSETCNEHLTFDTETSEFNSFSHKHRQTSHKNREAKRSPVFQPFDTNQNREFNCIKNWKDRSSSHRNPTFHQNYHEHREARRSSRSSLDTSVDEPFNICLPGAKAYPVEEIGQVLRPGMVLLKHYIPLFHQVDIVNRCQELGLGPGGFYRPGYKDGAKLRLYMMCLGLDWNPQTKRYGDKRHHDNASPPDIPENFTSLVCRALDDSRTLIRRELKIVNAEDELPAMSPDVCIVNFYNTNGRLGLHQDRDESKASLVKGLPVVSISIGDSAEFLYGDERDVEKAESVLLESGDVLIFGGESRHVFHGVKSIIQGTAPTALLKSTGLRSGRLNLTFRKY